MPIDFVILSGHKHLCLFFSKRFEPFFGEGTITYLDNVDMAGTRPLIAYVKDHKVRYFSEKTHHGKAEITIQIG